MKRLVLAPRARADLFDLSAYLADRNPLAAERLTERLILAMQALTRTPLLGRKCDDLGLPTVRRFVVEQHHLFYVLDGSVVQMIRILHGRRDVASEIRA